MTVSNAPPLASATSWVMDTSLARPKSARMAHVRAVPVPPGWFTKAYVLSPTA
jgi:hypothetical protein